MHAWLTTAHPLAPALGAALVFMASHAATEVVFSSYIYLPIAFGVIALINLCCGEAIPKPAIAKEVQSAGLVLSSGFILIFTVLLGLNMYALQLVTKEPDMPSLVRAVRYDMFEWADYMLTYVYNATDSEEGTVTRRQADVFAERLGSIASNTAPLYLSDWHENGAALCTDDGFRSGGMERAFRNAGIS